MILIAYILFAMLLLRFLVTLVNFASRPFLPKPKTVNNSPKVSILIPARNEEANLGNLLSDLQLTDYPNIEVLVCNDGSTDSTEQILQEQKKQFEALDYFNNQPLPSAWVGKNFACHQLAQSATGDYYLFLDADVRVKPDFLKKAIGFVQKTKVQLLSVFPEQIIESKGEWRTVPLMNWILLSFLPLPLVRWRWFSSLSAANGQFMLFDAKNYRQNQWHSEMKNRNVEDILIAKRMKKKKFPIAVLLGNNDVLCRMYTNYTASVQGFSLNIHQYFGGNRLWMVLFISMVWLRLPYFLVARQYYFFIIAVAFIVATRLMVSILSRHKQQIAIWVHFQQLVSLTSIAILNIKGSLKGGYEWKGRKYSLSIEKNK